MAYIPDISHYHPIKSFPKVKTACPFIISKATQGTNYVDPTLRSFVAGCESYGIPYWLYTYLNAGNELEQTKYMVNTCKGIVSKNFVGYILDVEAGNPAAGVREALNWLQLHTEKTMLYTMYAQYNRYKGVINSRSYNCAWWEARYGNNDGKFTSKYLPHSGCELHQYTSKGSCPGIPGDIDLNRICGGKSQAWFTGKSGSSRDISGKDGNEEMQCAFKVNGGNTIYWFDGSKFRTLYHIDQLNIIKKIYKANTGRDLPYYEWTDSAPWHLRLQQAITAGEKKFKITENSFTS